MRAVFLPLVACFALVAGTARGQEWPVPPPRPLPLPPPNLERLDPNSNYARAYRLFLNSPSASKSFYSSSPGRGADYATPWGPEGYYREPGYEYQRVSPYGYRQSSGYVPGYGGYTADPWLYQRYDVPGYSYGGVSPYLRTYPR